MPLKPWYKTATPREDLRDDKPLDASEFAAWCGDIGGELDASGTTAPILNRFATPVQIPAVTEPKLP